MKVDLKTTDRLDRFECTNIRGDKIILGNDKNSVGPMEAVLMAIAGCSTIDVGLILKKMRQDVTDIRVSVDSTRVDTIPRVFKTINLHFSLTGDIKEHKAEQAIKSSLEKYCSVAMMIEKTAVITTSFEILK